MLSFIQFLNEVSGRPFVGPAVRDTETKRVFRGEPGEAHYQIAQRHQATGKLGSYYEEGFHTDQHPWLARDNEQQYLIAREHFAYAKGLDKTPPWLSTWDLQPENEVNESTRAYVIPAIKFYDELTMKPIIKTGELGDWHDKIAEDNGRHPDDVIKGFQTSKHRFTDRDTALQYGKDEGIFPQHQRSLTSDDL